MQAAILTVSTSVAAGSNEDASGALLAEHAENAGAEVVAREIVPDDQGVIETALRKHVDAGIPLILTTGGTGLTPGDLTPEMTRRVIEREVPGIAEALRAAGAANGVPAAILSRGVAGMAGRTLIVNLPGSTGGVRDGMAVLAPVLGHAISQINGGDHVRSDSGGPRASGIA